MIDGEGAEAPPAESDGPRGLGGGKFGVDSPLFGGSLPTQAGAEEAPPPEPGYDPRHDEFASERLPVPAGAEADEEAALDGRDLMPAVDSERSLDDWGRDERALTLADPMLNFYYRYWFRVEAEGIENVPATAARCSSPTIPARCLRTGR